MFRLFNFRRPDTSGEVKRIYSDTELKSLESNDAYNRKKIFLNYVVGLLVFVISIVTFLFLFEVVTNPEFRTMIVNEIGRNLIYIVLYAIGILGIKNFTDKN